VSSKKVKEANKGPLSTEKREVLGGKRNKELVPLTRKGENAS